MENNKHLRIIDYSNARKYILRTKDKRIEIIRYKDKQEVELIIKRLRKNMNTPDGNFSGSIEQRGLVIGGINMTTQTFLEVNELMEYVLNDII